jgi:hypothetical protein
VLALGPAADAPAHPPADRGVDRRREREAGEGAVGNVVGEVATVPAVEKVANRSGAQPVDLAMAAVASVQASLWSAWLPMVPQKPQAWLLVGRIMVVIVFAFVPGSFAPDGHMKA